MTDEMFTPDTVDEQIDQIEQFAGASPALQSRDQPTTDTLLIRHLRYFYETEAAQADMASLARVGERLERSLSTTPADGNGKEQYELASTTAEDGVLLSYPPKSTRKRRVHRSISLIAAVVLLTLLVGSMVAVFNLARSSRSAAISGPSGENSAYVFDGTLYKLDLTQRSIDWSRQLIGLTSFTEEETQPVSNGIVYVSDITNQPYVYAFKAADGAQLWRTSLPSIKGLGKAVFTLQPVAVNGLVYTMTGNGEIFVLDAATGKPLRLYITHFAGVTAEDLVVGPHGTIYAAHGNGIIAIDDSNGSKLRVKSWTKYINSSQTISHIALDGDTLYVTSDTAPSNPGSPFTASLYALDATTGQQRWNAHEPSAGFTTPVVADGKVYVGAQNNDATTSIYAFDGKSGSLDWNKKTPNAYILKPVVNDGIVYVQVNTSSSYAIRGPFIPNVRTEYALDAENGAVRWQHRQARQDVLVFSFFERDGVLYMIGQTITQPSGRLVIEALNASTGQQVPA